MASNRNPNRPTAKRKHGYRAYERNRYREDALGYDDYAYSNDQLDENPISEQVTQRVDSMYAEPTDAYDALESTDKFDILYDDDFDYDYEGAAYDDSYDDSRVSSYSRYEDDADYSRDRTLRQDYADDEYYDTQMSADQFGRRASGERYVARTGRRRKRLSGIKKAFIALLVLLALGAGAAFAYVNMLNGNLSEGLGSGFDQSLVKTDLTNEPFYMLLLGTDASLEREDDPFYAESFRTDTIILARIDPVEKKVTLVSMPRDTMIDMGEYGIQKLNAAYAIDGASAAVEEVSEISGVGISHFCLVDMDGLKQVVDALGGIEVDVPVTIDDEDAGGHVDSGLHTLNGDEALILCRARNAFDDVGAGDSFRAANQRLVLQAVANKILSSDIPTIAKTCTTLSEYVTTDLTVNEIVGLAQAFQGMDTENNIYTASMPTESEYIDDLWYEVIIDAEWWYMIDRVDRGLPPTDSTEIDAVTGTVLANAGDESDGTGNTEITKQGLINVRNGTPQEGLGDRTAEILENEGYCVIDVANADVDTYQTTMVIYTDNNQEAEARQIAAALGGAEVFQNDGTYTTHDDFLVVVGADNMD